jgi:hypothetical protein
MAAFYLIAMIVNESHSTNVLVDLIFVIALSASGLALIEE